MGIRLAVFDLAGTTVNDEGAVNNAFREALATAGLAAAPEAVDRVMGLPKPEAIRLLLRFSLRDDLLGCVDGIHADFVARMVRFYRQDASVFEIPGAGATFARLRGAGIKVAVNTGFSAEITRVVLERMGWERKGLLDACVSSDQVKQGRPHADMIHHLMVKLGVKSPHDVAKIGDTPADLEEGANAGCGILIGVTWGTHRRRQLEEHPHTHLVSRMDDIPPILGG